MRDDAGTIDVALFSPWDEDDERAPEIKSEGYGDEELRRLLDDMTREMRAQFDCFRALREAAGEALAFPGDEAAAKGARADAKAASDAMSLIIRTLEKIDALQRQLAHDRQTAAEREAGGEDVAAARRHFLGLIDARAEEEAQRRFERFREEWLNDGAAHAGEPPAAPRSPPP